ncbi:cytochrome c biogenesis protein ResB [Geobacter sp.]|uniref:cytochrome c biogenesis protein ResB n=1 Tax=Geobacter sp. TaxID=46610 RepID=UPI0027BA7364|nr:cytochrome c biogenesis protein ResB [Geobacter sp.]
MEALKRLFLSRRTVIVLIGLTLAAIAIGALVPQAFITPAADLAAWRAAHPQLAPWADRLGLHNVFTTPAFAAVLFLSCISLGLSTVEQCRSSWRRTFAPVREVNAGQAFASPLSIEEVARRLQKLGYFRVAHGGMPRLVRHPWGYWGNALLHLGILAAIVASLCITLTQQQGIIHLVEGETHQPGQKWLLSDRGVLGREFVLPEAIRLERVYARFWPTHGLKALASTVSFPASGNPLESRTVATNSVLQHRGLRIYQGTEFGHAFHAEVTYPSGRKDVLELLIKHPLAPDRPGYGEFPSALGGDYLLRTKYFVDEEKKSLSREAPLLVIRVDEGGRELGQVPLRVGERGAVGEFRFRLLSVSKWSRLIFVNLTGISGVFSGFFIIVLGSILHYFAAPREILLQPGNGGCRVAWRAVKFAGFYDDEFAQLKRELGGETNNNG